MAGAALDALTSQLTHDEAGVLVIVQRLRPDQFFPAEQQQRLAELMTRWRNARDGGETLPAAVNKQNCNRWLKLNSMRLGAVLRRLLEKSSDESSLP